MLKSAEVTTKSGNKQVLEFGKYNIFVGLNGTGKREIIYSIWEKIYDNPFKKENEIYFFGCAGYAGSLCDYQEMIEQCEIIKSKPQSFVITHQREIINAFSPEDLYIVTPEKIFWRGNNKEQIESFSFCGLNTYDFYRMGWYDKEGWREENRNGKY